MFIILDGRPAFWYRGTGIGNYTHELIDNLTTIDSKNEYFVLVPENKKWTHSPRNFTFYPLMVNDAINFWERCINGEINIKLPVDIYHIPQNGIGLNLREVDKLLITLHDIIPFRMPETCNPKYLEIFKKEIPKIVESSKGIITVSEFSKKDIIDYFKIPESKVHVTKLAAETIYSPVNKNISKKFLKYNYGIDDDYILYVGGISRRKNLITLLNSFEKFIKSSNKKVKLVIAGNKSFYYPALEKRTSELGISSSVIYPGFIPIEYMPYFYSSAICLVYPSLYEGFGLPPVEALACGTPVISSSATSLCEILEDCALYFDPYDETDMSECMEKIIDDLLLREKLIKNGFSLTKKLTWENTARETLKIYESL